MALGWSEVAVDGYPPELTDVVVAWTGESRSTYLLLRRSKGNWVWPDTHKPVVGQENIRHWHYPLPMPGSAKPPENTARRQEGGQEEFHMLQGLAL